MNAHILLSGAALRQYNANFMELKKNESKKVFNCKLSICNSCEWVFFSCFKYSMKLNFFSADCLNVLFNLKQFLSDVEKTYMKSFYTVGA